MEHPILRGDGMLEQLRKNKRLWIVGAVVVVLLVVGIIVVVRINNGSEDAKGSDNRVELENKPEKTPDRETENGSNSSGLTVTDGDGTETVIDGSGSWETSDHSDNTDDKKPSGENDSKPSDDNKPSGDNDSKPSDDNKPSGENDKKPSEEGDISEEGTLNDGKEWTTPL